jgi:PAS domain S-box-containing protein
LQTLVAASPSVIYTTTQSQDGYACRFVSENLTPIMGYLPWEMRDNRAFWAKHVHSEDAERVFKEVKRLVTQGGGTVEYRFRHRRGHYVWVQDSFTVVPDKEGRPKDIVGSWADISDRKRTESDLKRLAEKVERHNRFICETFGRYLTDEVVATVLDSPTGLRMGGEKRKMLMADLRGFTSLSERLPRNGSSLCSIATSPPWSPSSSNTRARSMSSSATPSSSSLALRSGKRTMHSARSPAG